MRAFDLSNAVQAAAIPAAALTGDRKSEMY